MIKVVKKILIGSLSVLGISTLVWIVLLTNPTLSYAHQTQFDQVTVFHNEKLEKETELVIKNAIDIIKSSSIYDEELIIQLCLNDDNIYPDLHPIPGGNAYAFLDKTVIYACTPYFKENVTEFRWEVNNYELRRYNLTQLLAHEFMHNLQHNFDAKFYITKSFGKINWKLEGYAEYIARGIKNDGLLKEKIERYLIEETKDHNGVPVFELDDGTIQNLSYYKYAIVVQYLIEVKQLTFGEICNVDADLDTHFAEMINWNGN